jgi:Tol biopolymer transport system component
MPRFALLLTLAAALAVATPAHAATNGRIAFISDRYGSDQVVSVAADGSDPRRLTAGTAAAGPALAPDGARIAFARGGDIWVMNVDGSGAMPLTGTEGSGEASPTWSPDGTKLAFVSNRTVNGASTGPELWVMDASGANVRRLTDTATGGSFAPAWSPDGTRIAFHSNLNAGGFDLYTIAADSTPGAGNDTRVRVTNNFVEDENVAWAPDGGRLVFQRGAGAQAEIWVRTLAGAETRLTTNAVFDGDPVFSPDGTRILYTSNADGDLELYSMPAAGGAPVNVTNTSGGIADEQPHWGSFAEAPEPTPTPTPTASPGPGPSPTPTPGPTGPGCSDKARAGAAEAVGCLAREGNVWRSSGLVLLNGIVLRPVGAARLTIDPAKRTASSGSGVFAVELGGVVLFRGPIDWSLDGVITLGAKGEVAGMPIAGDAQIRFGAGLQGLISLPVRMPFLEAIQRVCGRLCPQVTAEATVVGDNAAGMLARRAWRLQVRNVLLGAARLEDLTLELDPAARNWSGSSKFVVTTPQAFTARADWAIENGVLRSATARLDGVRTPLSAGIFLRRLEVGVFSNPFELRGASVIEAGPPIRGRAPVTLDGAFKLRFAGPPGDARNFVRFDGQVQLLDLPVASGHAQLWPAGAFDFGLRVAAGFPNPTQPNQPVEVSAALGGWVTRNAFNAEANAEVRLLGQRLASGELVVSSAGFAACGELGWFRAGFGRRWGEPGSVFAAGCDVGPYRARAARAQDGPLTLELGDEPTVLRFRGAPRVVLEGPGGQRIDGPVVNDRVVLLQDADATYVALRRPGGTWRASTPPGSPAIAGVDSAAVLPKPKVTARVSGKGAKRVLRWTLARVPGQRVTFAEQGGNVLKRTTAARGRVRFTPPAGRSRTRRIVAIVEQAGVPRATLPVARYRAPTLKRPGKPRGLKVTRRGNALSVRWKRVPGASRYVVYVVGETREVLIVRKPSLRLPGLRRGSVEVTAQRADGVSGPRARGRAS